jgi:hypothetical protein
MVADPAGADWPVARLVDLAMKSLGYENKLGR